MDLTLYVETRLMGERPHLVGRRFAIADLASIALNPGALSIPEIMLNYDLSEAQVMAGIIYFLLHAEEIEAIERKIY